MHVALELGIIFVLVVLNGLLAMSEMAIVSSRRVRLQQQAEKGNPGALAALALAQAPSHFLSAVQIGITLISLLAGAFSGATLAQALTGALSMIPGLETYAPALGMGLVVLGVGYVSLVVGELVPKRLALNNAEGIAALVARPMRGLTWLAAPAVRLLGVSCDAVLHLLQVRPSAEPPITEEEIHIMVAQATEAGVLESAEQDMVARVFKLGDLRVDELMTPRPRLVWLDLEDPLELNVKKMKETGHTYYPVCIGEPDKVQGLVSIKHLWAKVQAGQTLDLRASLTKPLLVPERTRALKLLDQFRQSGKHLALVLDEYGSVQGLVTIIDVVEALVGQLPEAGKATAPQAVQRADGSWLIDGIMTIEDFKAALHLEDLPEEEPTHYQTIGGLVVHQLGRIPAAGDHCTWQDLRFEVMDMDDNRVDKVLVAKVPAG